MAIKNKGKVKKVGVRADKQKNIRIIYKKTKDVSDEEMQRRMDVASDLLFEEVLKEWGKHY